MKKFICLFLIVLSFSSCSLDEASPAKEYHLPVDHVSTVSDTINLGETSTILVTYRRPSDCYIFNGYTYEIQGFTRNVMVRCVLLNESDCPEYEYDNLYDVPLNFKPESVGIYTFRFWAGNNEYDQPVYIEHEIAVENNI